MTIDPTPYAPLLSAVPETLTRHVMRDLEAQRTKTKDVAGEEMLSLADWVNGRIAPAVKQAAQMAKHADEQTQYEAWLDAASIIVGRAEQVLLFQIQDECEHEWTSEDIDANCALCGVSYSLWQARIERSALADALEAEEAANEGKGGLTN